MNLHQIRSKSKDKGIWYLTPLSTLSAISWQSVLLVEETDYPEKTTDLPQSVSHNVVSSTPCLSLVLWIRVKVFNATVNSISVISWRAVLFVEETVTAVENHRAGYSLNRVSTIGMGYLCLIFIVFTILWLYERLWRCLFMCVIINMWFVHGGWLERLFVGPLMQD